MLKLPSITRADIGALTLAVGCKVGLQQGKVCGSITPDAMYTKDLNYTSDINKKSLV
ncbi:MAG: hypothetical protein U1E94_07560 [Agitococcus sp.]